MPLNDGRDWWFFIKSLYYKKRWNLFKILLRTSQLILLLQDYMRCMKCGVSFLQHFIICNIYPTEFQLRDYFEYYKFVITDFLEVLEAQSISFITRNRDYNFLLMIKSFFEIFSQDTRSLTVRFSHFKHSSRYLRIKIIAFVLSCDDVKFISFMISVRLIDSRCISMSINQDI